MTSRDTVQSMFDAVQKERPESWPHGIGFHLFDKSDNENVYLVRHKQSSVPIGFVGWQERKEAGQRVGYYSVGIMPEFRGQHFAKEALTKLIRIKSAGVDAVKALVQKDNVASIGLAESIGVPVIKCASFSMAEKQAFDFMPVVRGAGSLAKKTLLHPAVKDVGLGAAGAAAGYGLGKKELKGLEDVGLEPGSIAREGVPITNAVIGSMLSPTIRKQLYGDMVGAKYNRALLNTILGKLGMNAGLVAVDQGVGLAGKAQEAAKGLGDAGKAITVASDSFKNEVPKALAGISDSTRNIAEATKAMPRMFNNMADTAELGPSLRATMGQTSKSMMSMGDLAEKTTHILNNPATKTLGVGALGGAGGYALANSLLDDAPKGSANFNRNRRIKALAALLGAGGAAGVQHVLSPI